MEAFGKFMLLILLIIIGCFFDGYTFSKGWEWFISDTFGVIQLTIAQSVGVSIFIRYATARVTRAQIKSEEESGFEDSIKIFFVGQVVNILFLIFGYLIKGLL